jgi:hypothetical protein
VESCCELGNEHSGFINSGNLPNGCTTCGLSSGTQLTELVSYGLNLDCKLNPRL